MFLSVSYFYLITFLFVQSIFILCERYLKVDLKNIATEGKKNDLHALLYGIKQDVKNKFAKKLENNISYEMTEIAKKIESKVEKIKNITTELFVPYTTVLKNVFGRKFNVVLILICVIAAIICALKTLWLSFGISAGMFLLIIIINFVESIIRFKCVHKKYCVPQNQIHDESKNPEVPLISENEPKTKSKDNRKNTDLFNPHGV